MRIERLKAWNFKNFEALDLELRDFNVLIGANASGKSNALELLKFVRDIAVLGLDNAISLQGGAKYITNLRTGSDKNLRLEITVTPSDDELVARITPRAESLVGQEAQSKAQKDTGLFGFTPIRIPEFWQLRAEITRLLYTLSIHFLPDSGFELVEDEIRVTAEFTREVPGVPKDEHYGSGTVLFRNSGGTVKMEISMPQGAPTLEPRDISSFSSVQLPPGKTLSLEQPLFLMLGMLDSYRETVFKEIEIFDIDPKSPKFGVKIAGKADLEDDGQNLALVLKGILEDSRSKRKLSNLMKDLLPFVGDMDVEPFADRTFLFRLQEEFFPREYLPASLLSDGTINVTALIVALYFEHQSLVGFEEPERNLHPSLIAKVMEMFRDASQYKQVVITTHSPEVVRHAELADLILVSRNQDGISSLSRPSDKKGVLTFLKNEIGIDELYLNNMLEH